MVRALGRAWGGQLIFLVSILGCDNTKHPLGLARRCLVNLFFWRWEKTRGHPESERRGKLGAGAGSPPGSLGRGTGSGVELSEGSEACGEMGGFPICRQ